MDGSKDVNAYIIAILPYLGEVPRCTSGARVVAHSNLTQDASSLQELERRLWSRHLGND